MSACEKCCKCGAKIPYAQGVFLGVCTPCWNAAAFDDAGHPDASALSKERSS